MITLRDGRRLAYSVAGPEDGFPVLYFHGAIGTAPAIGAGVQALGLRCVCVSRPGFGGSDLAPGRTMLGFAADVEQLADALGLERFAVVGVSAGGPYALACGHALADRVTAIGAVSSLSPLCAPHAVPGMPAHIRLPLRALAGRPGGAASLGEAVVAVVRRHPRLLARAMTAGAPSCDRGQLAGRDARGRRRAVPRGRRRRRARHGRRLRPLRQAVGLRAGGRPARGARLPRRQGRAGAGRPRARAGREPAALPRLDGPRGGPLPLPPTARGRAGRRHRCAGAFCSRSFTTYVTSKKIDRRGGVPALLRGVEARSRPADLCLDPRRLVGGRRSGPPGSGLGAATTVAARLPIAAASARKATGRAGTRTGAVRACRSAWSVWTALPHAWADEPAAPAFPSGSASGRVVVYEVLGRSRSRLGWTRLGSPGIFG